MDKYQQILKQYGELETIKHPDGNVKWYEPFRGKKKKKNWIIFEQFLKWLSLGCRYSVC